MREFGHDPGNRVNAPTSNTIALFGVETERKIRGLFRDGAGVARIHGNTHSVQRFAGHWQSDGNGDFGNGVAEQKKTEALLL